MTAVEGRYRGLLANTARLGRSAGRHLVAFSGGVDSALVALAVREVFPASAVACIGVSASLPAEQRRAAEELAAHIRIPLRVVQTDEGAHPEYVANQGMSCYFCKTSLYGTMSALLDTLAAEGGPTVLFNGSNADDLQDPTRVGLKAASEFRVASPLAEYTKQDVRDLARHAGLPNWDTAASPCLRSRLQTGVPATPANLARVEEAEHRLRLRFAVPRTADFRVRHLEGNLAMIEASDPVFAALEIVACEAELLPLGFARVGKRHFVSGGVSGFRPPAAD
jgi:pyridinium-3,5-biscarboxylic acid mononucleotide sulfurtransferase